MGKQRIDHVFIDEFDDTKETILNVKDHNTSLGENWDEPVLIFHARDGNAVAAPWLDRGQVQDLMVVLGYWLKQTEGEDDGTGK